MKQFRQFFGMSFLPLLLILVSFNLFSQSKKDLQLQVDSLSVKNKVLEEKFRQVEGEMKIIQTKLFSQSQKDLQLQIDSLFIRNKSLEDKLKYMDGDLKNIQTNLLSVSTTMNMVSKFSTELENQVKAQSIVLQKLMAQNDSLRKTSIGKVEEKTVAVPKNEADSIIYAVQQYYAAKKWQNRLPFVLNKEKVEPLMEEAYQNNFRSYEIDKQSINIPGSRYVLGKTFKIFVDGEIVYIRKTNEGFKLDWEATKGYNAIDPSVVCAEKTNTATKLRAEVSLNDLYWIDYEVSKKSHLSLQISGCIGSSWISLSNAKIAELKKILSDGKSHQLIIEGAYKNFTTDGGFSMEFFIVSKLIKEGWDE